MKEDHNDKKYATADKKKKIKKNVNCLQRKYENKER